MKLAIGIVASHGFPVPVDFFLRYSEMNVAIVSGALNQQLPATLQITDAQLLSSQNFPVDVARNEIVRAFLSTDMDALLFLDCDMLHPVDLAARLLVHRKPVITARYHMRKEPYHAIAYLKHRTKDGPHAYAPVHFGQGVFEIERGGAGALLIQREVLEAIRARIGDNWFRYQRGPDGDFSVSEDFWFYQQAREAGYGCYCDWETECTHFAQVGITRTQNLAFLKHQIDTLPRLPEDERARVLDSLVVAGYPGGLKFSDDVHIPEHVASDGER